MAEFVIPRCAAPGCGQPLPPRGAHGRSRRYCSHACRTAAYRHRIAVAPYVGATFEAAEFGAVVVEFEPAELETWDGELEAWDGELEPAAAVSASPDEQVARAVLDARAMAGVLLRLGRDARPEFAWRCEKVGKALAAALDENFADA